MDKEYIEFQEFSDNVVVAVEEFNILTKASTNRYEFRDALEDLGFDNTNVSYESIIGYIVEYFVLLVKKFWEFLKNFYYKHFGKARRHYMRFSGIEKEFEKIKNKIDPDDWDYIGLEQGIDRSKLAEITIHFTNKIEELFKALKNVTFNITTDGVKLSDLESMMNADNNFGGVGSVQKDSSIDNKMPGITGVHKDIVDNNKDLHIQYLECKFDESVFNKYIEGIAKKETPIVSLKTGSVGYTGYDGIINVVKAGMVISKYIYENKAQIETILSRLDSWSRKNSKSSNQELLEGLGIRIALVKSTMSRTHAMLSYSDYLLTIIGNEMNHILIGAVEYSKL